jgi:hypothetical protein
VQKKLLHLYLNIVNNINESAGSSQLLLHGQFFFPASRSIGSRLLRLAALHNLNLENLINMPRRFWWPSSLSEQLVLIQNFQSKIPSYGTVLGLSASQLTNINTICGGFIDAYNFAEQCKATMKAVTQWRDLVFTGDPKGAAVPPQPVFPVGAAPTYTRGVITQFFNVRDQIVSSPGYNESIGQDLGIVGAEILPVPPSQVAPALKPVVSQGNWINLSGSMQGMDALRIEYAPVGGEFKTVAFLTRTPGGFQLNGSLANQPETGQIRAIFVHKNEDYGNFSPNYTVTVS